MKKFIALWVVCSAVLAEPSTGELKAIMDNVSSDYAECAAYFGITSVGVERSGEKELADKYRGISTSALTYAIESAKAGRTEDMAMKVTEARVKMASEQMMTDIGRDFSNLSILLSKYRLHCKKAMKSPEYVFSKWERKQKGE